VSFGKVTPEQKQEVEKFELIIYSWDEFLEVVSYHFSYYYSFSSHLLYKFVMKETTSILHGHICNYSDTKY
jgi:hypothetical protein